MIHLPMKSNIRKTVYKQYTILDIFVYGLLLLVSILIFMTNLKYKLYFAILWAIFSSFLMVPINKTILYIELYNVFLFLLSRKSFILNNNFELVNGKINEILDLNTNNIDYRDNTAYIMKLDIKYSGISDNELIYKILSLSDALRLIKGRATLEIISQEEIINYKNNFLNLEKLIKESKNNKSINLLEDQIQTYKKIDDDKSNKLGSYYIALYSPLKEEIIEIRDSIIVILEEIDIKVEILEDKRLINYIKSSYFFEDEEDRKLNTKQINFSASEYTIDNKYCSTISITGFPKIVSNAWGSMLFKIESARTVLRITPIDKSIAIKQVDRSYNELLSREEIFSKESENINNNNHINSMYELLENLQLGNEYMYNMEIYITLHSSTRKKLNSYKKNIITNLKNIGFEVDELYFLQKDAFLSSHNNNCKRIKKTMYPINTSALASIYPFFEERINDINGSFIGYNSMPVVFDVWKRNDEYQNSNAMVVGASGSGKSYFLKTLILLEYSRGTEIIVIDPENEYSNMGKKMNADIIDIGSAEKGRINPLHIYPVITDTSDGGSGELSFYSHLSTLETFFKILLKGAESEVLETINKLVIELYSNFKINAKSFNYNANIQYPEFEDLSNLISKKINKEKDSESLKSLKKASLYLDKFRRGGRFSSLWNGQSTLRLTNQMSIFNFQSLFSNKNESIANGQMLLVFKYIGQKLINNRNNNFNTKRSNKILLIADEAHMFIDKDSPYALDFFYEMIKKIRKYDGAFIPATQSISDWLATEEIKNKTTAILKETQYNFIFKLKSTSVEDLVELYKNGIGITHTDKNSIIRKKTGECLLISNDHQKVNFKVFASKKMQDFFLK